MRKLFFLDDTYVLMEIVDLKNVFFQYHQTSDDQSRGEKSIQVNVNENLDPEQ